MRRMTLRARRDEDGAVIVMMTAFVLGMVGMAALVVDVGALLDEERQLQNGADAGALAVAQSCALGSCDANQASALADGNSRDTRSDAAVSYPAARKVLVETSTSTAGTSILPYSFAQILSGVEGQTVHARATAIWGPVGKATVLRLAISQCDVTRLTEHGFSTVQSRIVFHDPDAPCGGGSGADAPGNFGWLEDDGSGSDCELTASADQKAPGKPGSSPAPADCVDPYLDKDILLPVFDDVVGVAGPGGNALYTIKGFAKFHLTGYRFGPRRSFPPACGGATSCIRGYFIRYVAPSDVIGGADFGGSTVKLFS